MRICLLYDCLYPHTIGGAERWYRDIGARLAAEGHDVTYVTLRQWDKDVNPDFAGVRVVTAGPRLELYAEAGRRRIAPPLLFGLGTLWHLLRHGRGYDVVHTASFPYFSLLAAGLARRVHGIRLLGALPGPDRRLGRLDRAAPVPARAAARVHAVAPAGRAAARGGLPRPGHRARRPLRGDARPRAGAARRSVRGLRRAAHPGEAGAGDRAGGEGRARAPSRSARSDLRRRARPRGGARGDRRARHGGRRRGAGVRRPLARGRRAGPGAVHGAPVAARGLRPGGGRGGAPRPAD